MLSKATLDWDHLETFHNRAVVTAGAGSLKQFRLQVIAHGQNTYGDKENNFLPYVVRIFSRYMCVPG